MGMLSEPWAAIHARACRSRYNNLVTKPLIGRACSPIRSRAGRLAYFHDGAAAPPALFSCRSDQNARRFVAKYRHAAILLRPQRFHWAQCPRISVERLRPLVTSMRAVRYLA